MPQLRRRHRARRKAFDLRNCDIFVKISPVDKPPVMNIAKAGQTIPLKWRITDANGNPVTNLTNVSVPAVLHSDLI